MSAIDPLRIQVVSDGRAGIENQALGLAEAIQRLTPAQVVVRRIGWRPGLDALPVWLKQRWMLATGSDAPFPIGGEPWPDLWIATGRATLPLSLAVHKRSGGRTFVVQTQDPRIDPSRFDLIVAPCHDGLSGPNVVSITGSPHRITSRVLAQAAPTFADRLAPLPGPRVAVMIGGRSRAFDLLPDRAGQMADEIARAIASVGGSLMLTFSRRTPDVARAIMARRLESVPGLIWDGTGANPLFAFLAVADHILVTEDSANMAAEAASTGRPVHVLAMDRRKSSDKFARLHADLAERGITRPFDGTFETWSYEPLNETDRAARAVLAAMSRSV